MLDLTQTLLIVVIVILTVLISFIGVQVILILKEVRASLARANQLIDQLENILDKLSHPAASINNLLSGVKQGVKIAEVVSSLFKSRQTSPSDYYESDLP